MVDQAVHVQCNICDLLWEKGPLGILIFIKIEFWHGLIALCAESNGASFMKKILITRRVMTIIFMQSGKYNRFLENAHF